VIHTSKESPISLGPLGNMEEDFVVVGMMASTIEKLPGSDTTHDLTWLILSTSARMGKASYLGRGRFSMEMMSRVEATEIIKRKGLSVVSTVHDYGVGGCISGLIEDIAERLGEGDKRTWQILYTASQLGRAKYHDGGKFCMERRCIPDVMGIVEHEGSWPNLHCYNIPLDSRMENCAGLDCRKCLALNCQKFSGYWD
jgi:hypothetical protein